MSSKIVGMVYDMPRGAITPAENSILRALADHADHWGNNIYPSNETIAGKTQYDPRSVQRIVQSLVEKKYLVKEGFSHLGTNRMYIPNDGVRIIRGGDKMSPLGVVPEEEPDMGGDNPLGDKPLGDKPLGDKLSPELNKINKRELSKETKEAVSKSLEWQVVTGDVKEVKDIDAPLKIFEEGLHFGTLPWYSNHDWTVFANWVIRQETLTPGYAKAYAKWRNDKDGGKFKAMSNTKIRLNPRVFWEASFPEFLSYWKQDSNGGNFSNDWQNIEL